MSLSSARPKRSCHDVENCEDTSALWWRKEKSRRKDERLPDRTPNDVSYKNNIHKPGISVPYVPKDVIVRRKWTRLDRRHRGNFYSTMSTNTYQWSKGEDNQRIQLKRMLTMGPVPTPYTIVQHSFQLTFRERRMENILMLFISRA